MKRRPARLNRMPKDREQQMEKIFRGALAIIAKHKAAAAKEAKEEKQKPKLALPGRTKPKLVPKWRHE